MEKLKSRKFWVMVAAFLASIGGSVGGVIAGNDTLAVAGAVCTMLSAAIYAALEATVDVAGIKANASTTQTNITATSSAKETVLALSNKTEGQ